MNDEPNRPQRREFLEQSFTYVIGGFSLVAALAWNDAIRGLFEKIFPGQNAGLVAKFVYAIVITLVVVFITVKLRRLIIRRQD